MIGWNFKNIEIWKFQNLEIWNFGNMEIWNFQLIRISAISPLHNSVLRVNISGADALFHILEIPKSGNLEFPKVSSPILYIGEDFFEGGKLRIPGQIYR